MVAVDFRPILLMAGLASAVFIVSMRFDPARPMAKALRHSVAGLGLLIVWNLLPVWPVGVNPLSAWVAGRLGLPGVCLLAVLSMLP